MTGKPGLFNTVDRPLRPGDRNLPSPLMASRGMVGQLSHPLDNSDGGKPLSSPWVLIQKWTQSL